LYGKPVVGDNGGVTIKKIVFTKAIFSITKISEQIGPPAGWARSIRLTTRAFNRRVALKVLPRRIQFRQGAKPASMARAGRRAHARPSKHCAIHEIAETAVAILS